MLLDLMVTAEQPLQHAKEENGCRHQLENNNQCEEADKQCQQEAATFWARFCSSECGRREAGKSDQCIANKIFHDDLQAKALLMLAIYTKAADMPACEKISAKKTPRHHSPSHLFRTGAYLL